MTALSASTTIDIRKWVGRFSINSFDANSQSLEKQVMMLAVICELFVATPCAWPMN